MRIPTYRTLLATLCTASLWAAALPGAAQGTAPDIQVTGNNVVIANGDTTPSPADYTDFGDRSLSAGTHYGMYKITNTGDADLVLSGISITGTHASDFSYSGTFYSFPVTLVPNASGMVYIEFQPTAIGTRNATLTINSNDADAGVYSFDLKGEGIEPEISVTGNGVDIPHNSYYPSLTNHTHFGYPATPGGNVVRTYTISNSGVTDLKIFQISLNSTVGTPIPFTIGGISLPTVIPPSSSTTFTITYAPMSVGQNGTFSGEISISNNDFDEQFFRFRIQGSAATEINLQGNGIDIADGDLTPSPADHTDFGVAVNGSEQVVAAFTIQSVGSAPLKINSIEKSSGNPGAFVISGITTPLIIPAGASHTFNVTFVPNGIGVRTTNIVLWNDDINEATYEFALRGVGIAAGGLDTAYHPNANRAVHTTVEQPDGKVLAGGAFVTVGGSSQVRVVRTLADGTVDPTFNAAITWPGATDVASVYVSTLVVLPDGKILVGGNFTRTDNVVQNRLARLNSDGSRDSSFTPEANGGIVHALCLQPDGKILVGGHFTNISGTTRTRLARLHANGTLDTGFTPTANGMVHGMALQPDGKVIIVGRFSTVNGTTRNRIARLNSNGTLDTGFSIPANNNVYAVALQPDGKIVIGGAFTTVNGVTRTRLARLNANGTLDTGFTATANDPVYGLTLQADGKILVSGDFNQLNSTAIGYCGRLNSDGTLDSGFNAGASSDVLGSHLKADGRVIIGGEFTSVQSTARGRIAMLNNNLATESLTVTDALTRVEWLRGGSSPEASRVIFELSTDGGSTWSSLGNGTRITDGWELTGLSLTSGQIRARAFTPSGKLGSSAGLVESIVTF
ncbi:delta-60 repeat domain-containing protein [Prosthecobacter debontii]|uniref:Delta-60 repeat domain-containing protein n=1 Tax=Prosthecobacter debontii TaxID=48467 RepID=A0A1T4Y0X3_9BACT|nr:choice-of-anchor D domain-containing protein [Prosthecobacter debontii]SKA94905.1 delta-60 repeat domain-containing protein [Prosthecobacter debontii]